MFGARKSLWRWTYHEFNYWAQGPSQWKEIVWIYLKVAFHSLEDFFEIENFGSWMHALQSCNWQLTNFGKLPWLLFAVFQRACHHCSDSLRDMCEWREVHGSKYCFSNFWFWIINCQVMNFVQISSTHFSPFEIQSRSSPAMSHDSLFQDQIWFLL